MNLFDSFVNSGLNSACEVFGLTYFYIENDEYAGIINEFQATKEQDLDGVIFNADATIVADVEQFNNPMEKDFAGKAVTVDGRKFTIQTVNLDTVSITFTLVNRK